METSMSILYDTENTFMKNLFRVVENPMKFEAGEVFFANSDHCEDQYRPEALYSACINIICNAETSLAQLVSFPF
jgi:hypothetical protein